MLPKTYEAILNGDRLEWTHDSPRQQNGVRVNVIVVDNPYDETSEERAARGKRLGEALRELAELNPFKDIDLIEWQREVRKDRPLPGRED